MPQTTAERTRTHRSRVGALEERIAALEDVSLPALATRIARLELLQDGGLSLATLVGGRALAVETDAMALSRAAAVEANQFRAAAAREWAKEHGISLPNGLDHSP